MMRPRLLIAVLISALTLSGCGGGHGASTGGSGSATLAGSSWVLDAPAAAATPTIVFSEREVSGSGGCNGYSGAYKLDGHKLVLGQLLSTQMGCEPAVSAVEAKFFAALGKVATWRLDGEQLVLSDSAGKELLRFGKPSLVGDWTVTSLSHDNAIRSPLGGTTITASFTSDGTLSGSAGCNTYTTHFIHEGSTLTITGAIAASRRHCETPAGVMEQENSFLLALRTVHSFRLEHRTLTLLRATGTIVATFEPAK